MHLPELQETQKRTLNTTTFLGYNHGEALQDGEMYDMTNLSSRSYPLLDQRPERAIVIPDEEEGQLTGILGREMLVTVIGTKVKYGEEEITGISVSAAENMIPKRIVSMGAYVCIWPDKVYFNTANIAECGSMGRAWAANGTGIQMTMCRGDGTDYDYTSITTSSTEPSNPTIGMLWMDTSGETHVLKQYSSTGEWTEIATTYIKISASGIGSGISMYDTVSISGMKKSGLGAVSDQIEALNTDNIVYGNGENYIIIAGILSQAISSLDAGDVSVNREVPDLDYICESNNRLWGCRYGIENGAVVNELKACKLGDFKNWNNYMGLSTDSYTASVGTDGPWTGCATQRGYPVFFKENAVHRVTGSTPSSFAVSVIGCRGIQAGSWRSAVVIDENIFYKSRAGVDYFDGSMAYSLSDALGPVRYSDARAGQLEGKYYISMMDTENIWHLFAYDTAQRTWHREDNTKALGFGTVNGELYAIDENNNQLLLMTGKNPDGMAGAEMEDPFPWSATFGLFGMDYTNRKYLSRFNLRMQMDEDAQVQLAIQYDQDGVWHKEPEIRGRTTRTFLLPVIPRRCDHLQVRISGLGRCRIYSMSRILEVGGDG